MAAPIVGQLPDSTRNAGSPIHINTIKRIIESGRIPIVVSGRANLEAGGPFTDSRSLELAVLGGLLANGFFEIVGLLLVVWFVAGDGAAGGIPEARLALTVTGCIVNPAIAELGVEGATVREVNSSLDAARWLCAGEERDDCDE
ncbi:MAG: hypothetical protein Q9219_001604 [cf. Caloplaca sp. 3 TL-2023]